MPGTIFSPLPIYAAAFLAGVSLLFSMPSLKIAWVLFAVACVIYTLLLVLKRWRLPVFLFLGGFAWAGLFTACQLSLTVPQDLAGKDIIVEGYIEDLPEAKQGDARAVFLYSLFGEITDEIHAEDPNHPVVIANGDVGFMSEGVCTSSTSASWTPR